MAEKLGKKAPKSKEKRPNFEVKWMKLYQGNIRKFIKENGHKVKQKCAEFCAKIYESKLEE